MLRLLLGSLIKFLSICIVLLIFFLSPLLILVGVSLGVFYELLLHFVPLVYKKMRLFYRKLVELNKRPTNIGKNY